MSLNPCFSGPYSRSCQKVKNITRTDDVLILVLVDHTLGGYIQVNKNLVIKVLILVLVDHTLGGFILTLRTLMSGSLNPCFSGPYSRRYNSVAEAFANPVLILVLVDHTLGGFILTLRTLMSGSLNPCFSGPYSRRKRNR